MKALTLLATTLLILCSGVANADVDAGKAAYASRGCIGCHGPGGISNNSAYPSLNGKSAAYIRQSLLDFRSGKRKNNMMNSFAIGLTDDDINNLVDYISTLN